MSCARFPGQVISKKNKHISSLYARLRRSRKNINSKKNTIAALKREVRDKDVIISRKNMEIRTLESHVPLHTGNPNFWIKKSIFLGFKIEIIKSDPSNIVAGAIRYLTKIREDIYVEDAKSYVKFLADENLLQAAIFVNLMPKNGFSRRTFKMFARALFDLLLEDLNKIDRRIGDVVDRIKNHFYPDYHKFYTEGNIMVHAKALSELCKGMTENQSMRKARRELTNQILDLDFTQEEDELVWGN